MQERQVTTAREMESAAMIRHVQLTDAACINRIYNHYVHHSIATFQEQPSSLDETKQLIAKLSEVFPFLVWDAGDQVLGYTYAKPWNDRSAYRFTVETSIFLDPEAVGQRIGSQLLSELIQLLKQTPTQVVIAGVSLPNPASIALHESFDYRFVGNFQSVGFKFGKWIDVGYWQKFMSKS